MTIICLECCQDDDETRKAAVVQREETSARSTKATYVLFFPTNSSLHLTLTHKSRKKRSRSQDEVEGDRALARSSRLFPLRLRL